MVLGYCFVFSEVCIEILMCVWHFH